MPFVYPANGKNSISAVGVWGSYAEMSRLGFVMNVGFFAYF